MAMASLDASLLARKGTARPVMLTPASTTGPAEQESDLTVHTHRPISTSKKQVPGKTTRHKKYVRLNDRTNRNLRILVASLGTSQQALMAEAIDNYLEKVINMHGCLCQTTRK